MNELKCQIEGCTEVFRTRETLSPAARFTCRNHTPTAEHTVRFQEHQFDKGLSRARQPEGTHHLPKRKNKE